MAAAGIEINKIRILARHSGDMILRYVADAPLRTLGADHSAAALRTGLRPSVDLGPNGGTIHNARLNKIEAALRKLEVDLNTQAQDLVALATGFARSDDRVFVQNTVTAAVHLARSLDGGHSVCGWRFATARRLGNVPAYRIVDTLINMPGSIICERCMPTEKAVALGAANAIVHELSGDE